METTRSPKGSSASSSHSSPFPSPSVSVLLKIKILSWSQETGLPACVLVRIADKLFNLHKHPLCSKSGYFHKRLDETSEVELPHSFPGGPEAFEMIALFIYRSSTLIDPINVASLRCAAEYLEMTEAYSTNSLCARLDLYLNQVVLQNWDDTLIVLHKCQMLLPWSEELLIVSRCIESLAFMACMEILDPERREQPAVTLDALSAEAWNTDLVKEIVSQDTWMKDLIALPFGLFERIAKALQRQGMKEKHVCPIIVFYATNWVLASNGKDTKPGHIHRDDDPSNEASTILQGILDLLPNGGKANRTIPVGFYLALLSKSLQVGASVQSLKKVQDHIVSLLHLAHVQDFLLPGDETELVSTSKELATMEGIFSAYVCTSNDQTLTPLSRNSAVADLWDMYLSYIGPDTSMGAERFIELIETVPISYRQIHDHLYAAMNSFLQAHKAISQEEKGAICKYLNCQRLSQVVCIEAVQNELMPLRLIVQALFTQQLNTQKTFKACSDSLRYTNSKDLSRNLSSSECINSKSLHPVESPYYDDDEHQSRPLSFLLQKQEYSRNEYESASFRIQNIEQELILLKSSIQQQTIPKKVPVRLQQKSRPYGLERRSQSKRRNPLGQTRGCIYSASFASQKMCASKILKMMFQRVNFFGKGKPKSKGQSTM